MGDKKQTSTDIIKDFLINHDDFGGKVADWKRESKETLKDTVSTVKRVFSNKETKQEVATYEISAPVDALGIKKSSIQTVENNVLFLFQETKAQDKPLTFETVFETDQDKIKAAEEFIDLIINDNDLGYSEWKRKQEELIEKCGPVAYFNQMCFTYTPEDEDDPEERYWFITPMAYVKKYGSGYDQHLSRGPWFMDAPMEGMFICDSEYQDWSIQKIANELMAIGCVFDKEYQRELNDEYVDLIPEKGKGPDKKKQPKP